MPARVSYHPRCWHQLWYLSRGLSRTRRLPASTHELHTAEHRHQSQKHTASKKVIERGLRYRKNDVCLNYGPTDHINSPCTRQSGTSTTDKPKQSQDARSGGSEVAVSGDVGVGWILLVSG